MIPHHNISFIEHFSSHYSSLRYMIEIVKMYRGAYLNYRSIVKAVIKKQFPVHAYMRNGARITLNSSQAVFFYALMQTKRGFSYDAVDDILTTPTHERFRGALNNGDVISIFSSGEYQKLPVKDKIVVDVGANIGDSLIYFASQGAGHVIGLEPFPKSYTLALENIAINNLDKKITLYLAGCSSEKKYTIIDPEYKSDIGSHMKNFDTGISVPVYTLRDILIENKISGQAVLKMDCEGCEYDAILSATCEDLLKFSYIQIEYHYGYKNLKRKLESCGFNVEVTPPRAMGMVTKIMELMNSILKPFHSRSNSINRMSNDDRSHQSRLVYMGHILAIRKN